MVLPYAGKPKRPPPTPGVSRRMSAIKSSGNYTTEVAMIQILRREGFVGWRRKRPVFGNPDFCWAKKRVALFVDGCFWHGCPNCKKIPKDYDQYWLDRIAANRKRDRVVTKYLNAHQWTVLRVWECQISSRLTVRRLRRVLDASPPPAGKGVSEKTRFDNDSN